MRGRLVKNRLNNVKELLRNVKIVNNHVFLTEGFGVEGVRIRLDLKDGF